MQPKVLIITDRSDLAETQLIIGLAALPLPVTVMANDTGPNYRLLLDAGVRAIPLRLAGRFDRSGTRAIRRELESGGYTVIYGFNPRAIACGLRASRGLKVKVMGYRGVIGNVGLLKPESWITFLHPRLDRVVCVSRAVQRYFESLGWGPFKLREGKAVTIYKGHDLSWYEAPPADLDSFKFPAGAFVVACIGRDRPGKGFATLIEAMEHVPETSPLHLLLVGELQGNPDLARRVETSRHRDRIHFAGFRNDAPQVAGACSALVLPSESEGLPRVVIEAMAYSRPVVVTEVGGMPELVDDGVEGFVVPVRHPQALAQALVRLANDPELATWMGECGRQRIERDFSIESTIRQTASLIQELTDELKV
ncbi:glycosyltransferase family 1 protein [Marinobacter vulgaris]|uniref:Glycosyltransferase family 1 protein n=2 Tax=Marinobacter vulgaris TaxID=1928331 RepID=A0A2V3ZHF4_9GAMM|nr:glycosyltransferase family 4 protein [Marinobacter vulgaris]PXX89316.1 glycosyltransferase family 1 protein [Marinobacter vulgaris]TSJ68206.1 glycosyltransferase family 4 protein [Marinobacter vulgaris]